MIFALLVSMACAAPVPTATPTPAVRLTIKPAGTVVAQYDRAGRVIYAKPGFEDYAAMYGDIYFGRVFLVTVTPTATPWPTELPTPTGDCCHHGHVWQPMKVGREGAGGTIWFHYIERNRRKITAKPFTEEFEEQASAFAQRCRRCGLWKEKS
jgi:hypothetical protein